MRASWPKGMVFLFGFLALVLLLGACLPCLAGNVVSSAPVLRPNVLLLVAEDMSSRVGAFGDLVAQTPNLDRLAREGTRYTHTFTTAGVCAPSRASLLTGMHAISMGGQHMRSSTRPEGSYRAVPPPEVKAFPELLRRAGYYTVTDSKLDYQFSGTFSGSGPTTLWNAEGNDPAWLANAELEQPFFALINFQVTHETGIFTPLGGGWPNSLMHLVVQFGRAWLLGIPEAESPIRSSDVKIPPYYADTPLARADIARHYNNIYQMDREVGAILDGLENSGLSDSTIVIWTTDHGDGLPRAKRELYDSGLRVPMIVRWPDRWRPEGSPTGAIDSRLVSFVDLAPTILAWAGQAPPPHMQGRNFSGPETETRKYVFASRDRIDKFPDRERAVRDRDYKYIRSWHPDKPTGHRLSFRDNLEMMIELWELLESGKLNTEQRTWFEPTGSERLYHLPSDPFELHNLAGEQEYAAELDRLRQAYEGFRGRVPDWSEGTETTMVDRMWPGGEQPRTAPPLIESKGGWLTLRPAEPHTSIAYRVGDGQERLYTTPFLLTSGSSITARSVRYGYRESQEVSWTAP